VLVPVLVYFVIWSPVVTCVYRRHRKIRHSTPGGAYVSDPDISTSIPAGLQSPGSHSSPMPGPPLSPAAMANAISELPVVSPPWQFSPRHSSQTTSPPLSSAMEPQELPAAPIRSSSPNELPPYNYASDLSRSIDRFDTASSIDEAGSSSGVGESFAHPNPHPRPPPYTE